MNPINNETINTILDLADGDSDILLDLSKSFLNDTKELLDGIKYSVINLNWEKLEFNVHTLKGLSATIGAVPLFEVCKQLNEDLKKGEIKKAISLVNSLNVKYIEVVDYIKSNYQVEDET